MKASCLCGGVTYEITGPIHRGRYCHCVHCRKFSGNGLRVFCSSCGSPLWYEPTRLPQFRGIPLGVIDDEGVPEPEMHVWTKSSVSWASISDDLPQHDTHP